MSQPALVVAGENDPGVPLRNGRLRVVTGGGHLFLLDEPEIVAPISRDFLNG